MLDYRSFSLDPIYVAQGVPAVLAPRGTGPVAITALDKTAGVALPSGNGGIEIETVRPAAVVIAGDLADLGVTLDQLDRGTITLNGQAWQILSHRPMPSPAGAADGEVYLILEKARHD